MPRAFSGLLRAHPYAYSLKAVKASFAKHRLPLRELRTPYGPHVVVLFDPRWHAPTFHLAGRAPTSTRIWVLVHAKARGPGDVRWANVSIASRGRVWANVSAALDTLKRHY
jgi:hypothetical protein